MKVAFFTLYLFAASIHAFILSPTCLSTIHKAFGKFDRAAQEGIAHVCDQGCVLTADKYHDNIRANHLHPAMQKAVERHITHRDVSEDEMEEFRRLADTVVEEIIQTCVPTGTAHPESFDICKDTKVAAQCASKMKMRTPAIMMKHRSIVLSFSDNESCRVAVAAIEDPELWTLAEETMDIYAQSCPMRMLEN